MANFRGISADQLRKYIERVERLEIEKTEIADTIKDVFNEAKANGFEVKIMKKVIKLRKMDRAKLEEEEAITDVYLSALGMRFGSDDDEAEAA